MSEKKYLLVKRNGCIGCGACMVASNNKCYFLDGKSWCKKEVVENANEVAEVCPTNVIEVVDLEEYEKEEKKLIEQGLLPNKE